MSNHTIMYSKRAYFHLLQPFTCHLQSLRIQNSNYIPLLTFSFQISQPSDDTQVSKQTFTMRNGSSSSTTISSSITVQQQSSSTLNLSTLQANVSTLHRKANSNVNISTLDSSLNNNLPAKPVISHGKPNLAPKPPLNGKFYY